MSDHRYLIGSGYHAKLGSEEFAHLWHANIRQYAQPSEIVVIADSNSEFPRLDGVQSLKLSGNLGGCMDLIEGRKKHHFPGGPSAVMALALLAYISESDFVYQEQDCLAFGPWVERIYSQISEHGLICGKQQCWGLANCLFMVRHAYIPTFVRLYLETPPEDCVNMLCESKFKRLLDSRPTEWTTFGFGYDRDRPINFDDEVWYAQQFSREEMEELELRGLIKKSL